MLGGAVSEFASTYDALAPRYDAWSGSLRPDIREAWVRKVGIFVEAGARVIELGCGTGVPVGSWLASRYVYTGVDASPGMLAHARRQVESGTFLHADMETVSFEPQSLGAVIAFSSIIHVPRERHADLFVAIASWLRAGGVFAASLHSRDDPNDFDPDWLGGGPMRWTGFDRDTNVALLDAAGLEIIESEVVEQVEPDGCVIHPFWLIARKRA
jgi:SAM-dependent methyltransferase